MQQPIHRRLFLKYGLGATTLAATAGLLTPQSVLAAWNQAAFGAKSVDGGLDAALGASALSDSGEITVKAPDLAENGAVVPVTVASNLPDTTAMALLFTKNSSPLCCVAHVGKGMKPEFTLRIKMGESGEAIGVVQAGGKLYAARQQVKVTAGGCAS